jgi:large subunit ribosomal protein L25
MEMIELKAEPRQVVKKGIKDLRRQGLVPAVMYGKSVESIPLQIEERALNKVLFVAGTHQLISLRIGDQKPRMTLARDIQRDVIKRNYLHVDFYAVKMDQKVTAQVPLVVEGVSPAVRDLGGILTQGLDQLEVECLPSDLLSSIMVNVESLTELNSAISVSDLSLPDTITLLSDPESMIIRIEPPRKVVEEEVEAEEEVLEEGVEPEVITEAKEEQ